MALVDTLLVFFILTIMAIFAYLKMTNKTLSDFVREIRDIYKENQEEVIDI